MQLPETAPGVPVSYAACHYDQACGGPAKPSIGVPDGTLPDPHRLQVIDIVNYQEPTGVPVQLGPENVSRITPTGIRILSIPLRCAKFGGQAHH
jgi:hypothetical protein